MLDFLRNFISSIFGTPSKEEQFEKGKKLSMELAVELGKIRQISDSDTRKRQYNLFKGRIQYKRTQTPDIGELLVVVFNKLVETELVETIPESEVDEYSLFYGLIKSSKKQPNIHH